MLPLQLLLCVELPTMQTTCVTPTQNSCILQNASILFSLMLFCITNNHTPWNTKSNSITIGAAENSVLAILYRAVETICARWMSVLTKLPLKDRRRHTMREVDDGPACQNWHQPVLFCQCDCSYYIDFSPRCHIGLFCLTFPSNSTHASASGKQVAYLIFKFESRLWKVQSVGWQKHKVVHII